MDRPADSATVWHEWHEWHAALRRYLARRLREPADVDDVLQDVYLKLHAHHASLREPGRVAAWLYRVADHAIADHYRARRPWDELPEELPAPPVPQDCTAELAACLIPMIAALPDIYRDAVRLSEIDGLSQQAVAQRLGLSLSGAKSRVQRGREKLRALLLDCCHIDTDAEGLACKPRLGGKRYC